MNQILCTKLNKKSSNKTKWFKIQFVFSIFIILLTISFGVFYYYDLVKKENLSNDLISNYSIYRLYSAQNKEPTQIEENFNGLFRYY